MNDYDNSTKGEVISALEEIAQELGFDIEGVDLNDDLFDIGLDSLDLLEIVMSLEDRFDIEISDKDINRCLSIEELVDLVLSYL